MDQREVWESAKDVRSDGQVKNDYDFGKQNEQLVFENIRAKSKYMIESQDEFGVMSGYRPDCFVLVSGMWLPADIKFMVPFIKELDFKQKQVEFLMGIGGIFIIGNSRAYGFISAKRIFDTGQLIPAESSKLKKDSYRALVEKWYEWDNKNINWVINKNYEKY